MCGLCGYVGLPELVPPPQVGRAMSQTLAHRGPDGAGELEIASSAGPELAGWLGHRRLRIIDLTDAAHQPMPSDDKAVALVYNGEVYNFRELRRELSAAGIPLPLHRRHRGGPARLRGMGGGIRPPARRDVRAGRLGRPLGRLLLARDRTGKKPLFYASRTDG